jgi:hypothetical protein
MQPESIADVDGRSVGADAGAMIGGRNVWGGRAYAGADVVGNGFRTRKYAVSAASINLLL